MSEPDEQLAQRIADRGREALLERLRPAFAAAAAAHADVIQLDEERIEQMVQRAADRADGLQWRRALAGVAVDELGIGLAEALGHPAVVRAQELAGAPSYEDALAGIGRGEAARADAAEPQAEAEAEPEREAETEAGAEPEAEPEAEAEVLPEQEPEAEPEPEPEAEAQPEPEAEPEPEPEPEPEAEAQPEPEAGPEAEPEEQAEPEPGEASFNGVESVAAARPTGSDSRVVTLRAVHLEGLQNAAQADADLRLRFSGRGIEVLRRSNNVALARMRWREIQGIELPHSRGRLRRRRREDAQITVHSERGRMLFEVPGVTADEVKARLAPIVEVR